MLRGLVRLSRISQRPHGPPQKYASEQHTHASFSVPHTSRRNCTNDALLLYVRTHRQHESEDMWETIAVRQHALAAEIGGSGLTTRWRPESTCRVTKLTQGGTDTEIPNRETGTRGYGFYRIVPGKGCVKYRQQGAISSGRAPTHVRCQYWTAGGPVWVSGQKCFIKLEGCNETFLPRIFTDI